MVVVVGLSISITSKSVTKISSRLIPRCVVSSVPVILVPFYSVRNNETQIMNNL